MGMNVRGLGSSVVAGLLVALISGQVALGGVGESASALVYVDGGAWLNGSEVGKTGAVFAGDLLQTRAEGTARIQGNGSSVVVLGNSLVKYGAIGVDVEHGSVRVRTSRGMVARAGELTVRPAGAGWTEFEVRDVDGQVEIAADRGDVTVQDEKGTTTTVAQGQQTTRDDTGDGQKKKKRRKRGAGAEPAAQGGIMSSTLAVTGGLVLIGGAAAWVWTRSEPPASPSCPSRYCP